MGMLKGVIPGSLAGAKICGGVIGANFKPLSLLNSAFLAGSQLLRLNLSLSVTRT